MNLSGFFDWLLAPKTELPVGTSPQPPAEQVPIVNILDYLASDEGEEMGEKIISLVALFFPEAAAFRLSPKVVQRLARLGAYALKSGLADGSLLPDGQGGIISRAWADDPRHALNPDGTFRDKDF